MTRTAAKIKVIKVQNNNNLPTIEYSKLQDFQGDLKYLTQDNLNKLKNSILQHGIIVPKFVWQNNGNYFIIDGHQTKTALASLEGEGYFIPPIPYINIQAKDRKEAAEILLKINSNYGLFNPDTTFFINEDLDLKNIKLKIEIPELYLDSIEYPKLEQPIGNVIDDPNNEWQDMPEYNQKDLTPFKSIYVHFKDQESINDFAKLLNQKISDKTKYLWFPKIEIIRENYLRYEDSNE